MVFAGLQIRFPRGGLSASCELARAAAERQKAIFPASSYIDCFRGSPVVLVSTYPACLLGYALVRNPDIPICMILNHKT